MTRRPFKRPAPRSRPRLQTADPTALMLPILLGTLLMGFMAALI